MATTGAAEAGAVPPASWDLPREVAEAVLAALAPSWRGVARHVCRGLRAAAAAVPGGAAMRAEDLCLSVQLGRWARAQGCPWTLDYCLEIAAGALLKALAWKPASVLNTDSKGNSPYWAHVNIFPLMLKTISVCPHLVIRTGMWIRVNSRCRYDGRLQNTGAQNIRELRIFPDLLYPVCEGSTPDETGNIVISNMLAINMPYTMYNLQLGLRP